MNTTLIIIIAVVITLLLLVVGGVLAFFLLRGGGDEAKPKSKTKTKSKAKIKPKKKQPKQQPVIDDDDEYDDDDDEYEYDDDDEIEDIQSLSSPLTASAAEPVVSNTPLPELDDIEADDDRIRILVVDDNPDTRDNVSRLLYFEKDMDVIGDAKNGREGIEQAIALTPHIVIMDINMPDVDGITATREMALKAPFSQVIIMSVQAEPHYMRQAMAAGARDFQPKPFTAEELVSSIRRVYKIGIPTYREIEAAERYQKQQNIQSGQAGGGDGDSLSSGRPPVIAVYSPKGGIGTSSMAINLAVALQQDFGGIALVDGDLQFGDIAVHLNTKPRRTISDIMQNGVPEIDILSELTIPHSTGLQLLLAPPQPEFADEITPETLVDVLDGLRDSFAAIIVDTNSYLSEKNLAVLDAADYIVLITAPELPGIKSAKQFLELAEQLEIDRKRIGVVINRAALPGGVNPDQIETALNLDTSYRVPHDPKLLQATRRGAAVVQKDPGAPSARALKEIGQDIWQKVAVTPALES